MLDLVHVVNGSFHHGKQMLTLNCLRRIDLNGHICRYTGGEQVLGLPVPEVLRHHIADSFALTVLSELVTVLTL